VNGSKYIEGTPDLAQCRGKTWRFSPDGKAPSIKESSAVVTEFKAFFSKTWGLDLRSGELVHGLDKERTLTLTLSARKSELLVQMLPALSQWLAVYHPHWRIAVPTLGSAFAFVIYPGTIRWPMEDRWSFEESIVQAAVLDAEDYWLVGASMVYPYDFE
jgi:hypothetical protein